MQRDEISRLRLENPKLADAALISLPTRTYIEGITSSECSGIGFKKGMIRVVRKLHPGNDLAPIPIRRSSTNRVVIFHCKIRLTTPGKGTRMSKFDPRPQDEIRTILDALKQLPDKTAYHAAAIVSLSGLRMREIARLEWADVDLQAGEFKVAGRHGRMLPINPELQTVFEQRRGDNAPATLVFGHHYPCLVACVNTALKRVCRQLHLSPATARTLRHSFVLHLCSSSDAIVATHLLGCGWRALPHL